LIGCAGFTGESELIKDFLTETDTADGTVSFVDIKILVFNDELVTLNIQRNTTAMEIYNLLAQVAAICLTSNYCCDLISHYKTKFFRLLKIRTH
jgi:hypothetical protein